MKRNIPAERTLCQTERYQGRMYTEEVFQGLWGKKPEDMKIARDPVCLLQSEEVDEED